jgi:hypothetical protein
MNLPSFFTANVRPQQQPQSQPQQQPQQQYAPPTQPQAPQPPNPLMQMIGNMFRTMSQPQQQQQHAHPAQPGQPAQPAQGPTTSPQQQPAAFNPQGAMQMLGPLFQQIVQPLTQARAAPTQSAQQQPPQQPQPQPQPQPQVDINQVMSQVLGSIQTALQPPQPQPQQQQQQQQQRQTQPPDFGTFMTQMLGTISQAFNPPTGVSPSPSPAQSSPQQQPPITPSQQQQAGSAPNQNMLASLFNVVMQSAGQGASTQTVGSVVRTLSQNMHLDEEHDREGPLEMMLHVVMDTMPVSDLTALAHGDWSPLQRVHPTVLQYIRDTVINRPPTEQQQGEQGEEARISQFADESARAVLESVASTALPPDVMGRVRAGADLAGRAGAVIRQHVTSLIHIVLSAPQPTPEDPIPFARAIQAWCADFVRQLVDAVASCLGGGIGDASIVIQRFLEQRLSFMGPQMAQVAATMVTSYILRAYNNVSQQQQQPQQQIQQTTPALTPTPTVTTPSPPPTQTPTLAPPQALPTPSVPTPTPSAPTSTHESSRQQQLVSLSGQESTGVVPSEWQSTIAMDEARQAQASPQRPFSDSYMAGAPNKRRKTQAQPQSATPESLLSDRLREAMSPPGTSSNSDANTNNNSNSQEGASARTQRSNEEAPAALLDGPLPSLYTAMLSRDIANRLRIDPDYDPSRFPNIDAVFHPNDASP